MSSEIDRRAVPDEVTALLTVKIGEVSRTSRKHLTIITFSFLLSEGLDVLRAKTDSCTEKVLSSFQGERHVRHDMAMYMRPGAHSKQAELVEITHDNFHSRLNRSYKNYLKRKTHAPFQCEIYVYVKKLVPSRRRRLKETGAVVEREGPEVKRNRFTISEEGDEEHRTLETVQGQQVPGGYYRPVRMLVNGAVVPVQVNVQDLLACFTLFQQQTLVGSTDEDGRRDYDRGGHEAVDGADPDGDTFE
ncbi:unnamed protein product [Hyaloperonospora brassicae]|uniref:Uncharacterized protein n=1 Tax=Hyaloperonospora brassicae TaxID=162125 RepID=A0AAV0V2L7_HYABA|nr:unnamed protein product [Hyaloperonospora brassicae]